MRDEQMRELIEAARAVVMLNTAESEGDRRRLAALAAAIARVEQGARVDAVEWRDMPQHEDYAGWPILDFAFVNGRRCEVWQTAAGAAISWAVYEDDRDVHESANGEAPTREKARRTAAEFAFARAKAAVVMSGVRDA